MKKHFLVHWDTSHHWERNLTREEKENFLRKRALTRKEEKNIKENITINQVPKGIDSLAKPLIV